MTSKLERLIQRIGVINGDPEDIVHCNWLQELESGPKQQDCSLITKDEHILTDLPLAAGDI